MHKELSKQVNTVDFAEDFKEDYIKMIEKNTNLRLANSLLKEELENKEKEIELQFESKSYNMEREYKKEIHKLKQENKHLNKMIYKFRVTLKTLKGALYSLYKNILFRFLKNTFKEI